MSKWLDSLLHFKKQQSVSTSRSVSSSNTAAGGSAFVNSERYRQVGYSPLGKDVKPDKHQIISLDLNSTSSSEEDLFEELNRKRTNRTRGRKKMVTKRAYSMNNGLESSREVYGPPMHKRNICWNPYGRGDINDIYWNPPATTTTRHHLPNCPCELAYEQTYEKDLIYSKKRIRNIRIILGIVGAIIFIGLVSVAVVFLVNNSSSDDDDPSGQTGNGIKLDDILSGKLQARRFNGSWSSGSNIIFKENNHIYEYNVANGKHTSLLHDDKQQYAVFEKSADGNYLLLGKNHLKIFRHSFQAEYDIVDLQTGAVHPLKIKGNQELLYLVQWAPVGNALIINFQRNLYYKPTALDSDEIQLTNDANPTILNGIPDWVYEEEVFGSNSAIWFNPNGTKIAFIQFNDTPTKVINFPYYGEAGDLRYQYPWNQPVAYPKAGSPNPFVKLFTADLVEALKSNDFLTEIPVPSTLNTQSHIITIVSWLNDQNVLSVWMNRIQNAAYMQVFEGLRRTEIFSIESKTGWVDLFTEPLRNKDGSEIALLLPQRQGEDGDFRHLSLLTTKAVNVPVPITSGKYVVTSVLHWDGEKNIIFYTANTEDASNVMHVYAIKAAPDQKPQCLTCNLPLDGTQQSYFAAEFSKGNYVVISTLGPNVPSHAVYEWTYINGEVNLTKVIDWELNKHLKSELAIVAMPEQEIHTINIANGFTAKVLLQLPPNIDRSGNTKYPMLVDVYGGPDSYSVTDKWGMDWGTYLSSNQSVIYAKIDGRGSGLRGDKLLHSIYLKLGTVEITDQIEVTRSLQQKLSYIDANRTGIWGWSYGGYAAAMALANDQSGSFKCAASIAPVTDWAYYDSIYTERYMGVPEENPTGYDNSRLSTMALKFKGKKFLLVHGTLDDNVHYQQAMILAKNLERRDILFKQISYPDEDHGLAGVRPHLYHSLDKFFGECFNLKRLSKWGRK